MKSSMSEEIIKVKNDINAINGRLDEIEYKLDKSTQSQSQQSKEINATLYDWNQKTLSASDKKTAALESQIESLKKEIYNLKTTQEQDKKELTAKSDLIVDEVSKENKELRDYVESLRKAINTQPAKKSEPQKTESEYYTVSQGDTLLKISQKTGVSMSKIMEINEIKDPNSVHIGQKLRLKEYS